MLDALAALVGQMTTVGTWQTDRNDCVVGQNDDGDWDFVAELPDTADTMGVVALINAFADLLALARTGLEADQTRALYHELLMAVERTHPSDSRHQTALRYIQRAEARSERFQQHAGREGDAITDYQYPTCPTCGVLLPCQVHKGTTISGVTYDYTVTCPSCVVLAARVRELEAEIDRLENEHCECVAEVTKACSEEVASVIAERDAALEAGYTAGYRACNEATAHNDPEGFTHGWDRFRASREGQA